MIKLNRFYTPLGIIGHLQIEESEFWTLEDLDCVPDGHYYLERDFNNLVDQLTAGKYDEGWRVDGTLFVCGRFNGIKIIDPDSEFNFKRPNSEFERFMDVLDTRNEWEIEICHASA